MGKDITIMKKKESYKNEKKKHASEQLPVQNAERREIEVCYQLRDAAQKKQTNFGTFPKLPRPSPPYFGPPESESTFQIIFFIFFYHPTHSEGSRVGFMRYEKCSTTMDVR